MAKENVTPLLLKYQKQYDNDPRSRVFAPLAEGYRKLGFIDKAIQIVKQGIRYNPSYVMGYLTLASCYFDLKEFQLAYSTLRPLVADHRDNLKMQKIFAEVCSLLNNDDEALETYKYLLFVNPKDPDAALAVKRLETPIRADTKVLESALDNSTDQSMAEQAQDEDFSIENLSAEPQENDYWTQVDFSQNNNISPQEMMSEGFPSKNIIIGGTSEFYQDESPQFQSTEEDREDEEQTSPVFDETPVITHTLVDLYCGQGHISKAIEILEKIVELHPHDQSSLLKLSELKKVISDLAMPAPSLSKSLRREDNSQQVDNRPSLMDIIDQKFSKKKEKDFDDISKKLWQFHGMLKEKAHQTRCRSR